MHSRQIVHYSQIEHTDLTSNGELIYNNIGFKLLTFNLVIVRSSTDRYNKELLYASNLSQVSKCTNQ